MKLDYLGAGYPLFYNWLKCCILLLLILLLGSEGYNLITNYYGTDCNKPDTCKLNYVTIFSLANKTSRHDQYKIQTRLFSITYILTMITLMIFRKIQRRINSEVDQNQLTPSDYTIIVKNIPIGLKNFNYIEELKSLFEKCALNGDPVNIMKINLIYDVSKLNKVDKEMDIAINEKKKVLKKNGFRLNSSEIQRLDYEFENLKDKKTFICKDMKDNYKDFIGIALISLETEQGFIIRKINKFSIFIVILF